MPDETPLEAAIRELAEETGLTGRFPIISPVMGVPPGLLGYEEHVAGSKGLHMNFVFVADVDSDVVISNGPSTIPRRHHEFEQFRWVTLDDGPWEGAPPNVRDFAVLALEN